MRNTFFRGFAVTVKFVGGCGVGEAEIGPAAERRRLAAHAAGVLSEGNRAEVQAGEEGAVFLLLTARPQREPVFQYVPFVINARNEIEQALADYRNGQLV